MQAQRLPDRLKILKDKNTVLGLKGEEGHEVTAGRIVYLKQIVEQKGIVNLGAIV